MRTAKGSLLGLALVLLALWGSALAAPPGAIANSLTVRYKDKATERRTDWPDSLGYDWNGRSGYTVQGSMTIKDLSLKRVCRSGTLIAFVVDLNLAYTPIPLTNQSGVIDRVVVLAKGHLGQSDQYRDGKTRVTWTQRATFLDSEFISQLLSLTFVQSHNDVIVKYVWAGTGKHFFSQEYSSGAWQSEDRGTEFLSRQLTFAPTQSVLGNATWQVRVTPPDAPTETATKRTHLAIKVDTVKDYSGATIVGIPWSD
jgi:hypothetical protein